MSTTLKVSRKLRDELALLGDKDDTFEGIIQRLIDEHKEKEVKD